MGEPSEKEKKCYAGRKKCEIKYIGEENYCMETNDNHKG